MAVLLFLAFYFKNVFWYKSSHYGETNDEKLISFFYKFQNTRTVLQRNYNTIYIIGQFTLVTLIIFDKPAAYLYSYGILFLLVLLNDLMQNHALEKQGNKIKRVSSLLHHLSNITFGAMVIMLYIFHIARNMSEAELNPDKHMKHFEIALYFLFGFISYKQIVFLYEAVYFFWFLRK